MTSLGIDIGGTAIKAGVFDGDELRALDPIPTPTNPDDIVQAVIDIARKHPQVDSVGVAVAAFLDRTRRRVLLSPNISWSDRALADELEQALGVPVGLENDANAAGFAEYSRGAGRGASSMVMLTLGTGVGGAVIVGGQLLTGPRGIAGELGHIIVEPGGVRCGCGQRGCVETVASGTALMRLASEALGEPVTTAGALETALHHQPRLREQLLVRASEALVLAVANLQAVVDPDVVVVGGGVAERLGSELFEALGTARGVVLEGRRSDAFADIRPAMLGNRAGTIGAALLAMSNAASPR